MTSRWDFVAGIGASFVGCSPFAHAHAPELSDVQKAAMRGDTAAKLSSLKT